MIKRRVANVGPRNRIPGRGPSSLKQQKAKIFTRKLIWLIPGGIAKALGGHSLELMSRPQQAIAKRIASLERERKLALPDESGEELRARACSSLFQP